MAVVAGTAVVEDTCISCEPETADLGIGVGRWVIELVRKRKCCEASPALSRLESLPEEVLIRVLCCVDHADLNQLVLVSKTIHEATLMATRLHFAFSTPPKSSAFRNSIDLDDALADDRTQAPCPPKMKQRRLNPMKMAAVSVVLFNDAGEDGRIGHGRG